MKKLNVFIAAMLMVAGFSLSAQVAITTDGSSANGAAMLDVQSTSKGFLPPRMTYAQRVAIASPVAGLMVWCSNCGPNGEMQVYNGTAWTNFSGSTPSGSVPDAPVIGTATAGNAQASVPFTQPASNGGSTIISYTATSSPGSITGTLTQAGSGTITVSGLTNGTAYTFTVTATNATGTGAASAASNSVTPITSFTIGQSYQGGKIFYIDGTGLHGLICATEDQSTGIIWALPAYQNTLVPGGTSTELGTGLANTTKIIAQNGAGTTYAAGLARAYNGGSYNDWYLPSKLELDQMYLSRSAIGFDNSYYWSSSENTTYLEYVWIRHLTEGSSTSVERSNININVRAIRSF
jgi:hypothetical protein